MTKHFPRELKERDVRLVLDAESGPAPLEPRQALKTIDTQIGNQIYKARMGIGV